MANIPLRSLEVAFGINPYSATTDVQYTYIGGDATALNPSTTNGLVRNITTQRGKQQQLNKFEAGRMTAVLDNRDGRFDPSNTAGIYYGHLLPMQAVRLRVWVNRMLSNQAYGINTTGMFNDLVNCTLGTGTIISPTPRFIGLSDLAMTATANGTMSVVARTTVDNPAGASPYTHWDDTKGYPVTGGETYTAVASYQKLNPIDPARVCTTTIQWRDGTGAIISTVTSIGVTEPSNSWIDDSVTGIAPLAAQYASVQYSVLSAGAGSHHYVCAMAFWSGTDIHLSYDATLGSNLTCLGIPLFTGFADGWQCDYVNPYEATCTLTASDAFKLFQNRPVQDAYAMEVLATNPSLYWRLNEPAGSNSIGDSVGTNPPGKVSLFNVTLGTAFPLSPVGTGIGVVSVTNTAAAFGVSNTNPGVGSITQTGLGGGLTGSGPFSIMLWINCNSGVQSTKPGSAICTLLYQNSPDAPPGTSITGSSMWDLELNYTSGTPNRGDLRLVMYDIHGNMSQTGALFASAMNSGVNLCDGFWHHIAVSVTVAGLVTTWIDNVLVTTISITPRSQTLNPVTAAAKGPGFPQTDAFPGILDEIAIWNNFDVNLNNPLYGVPYVQNIILPVPTRFAFSGGIPNVPVGTTDDASMLQGLLNEVGWKGVVTFTYPLIGTATTIMCPFDDMANQTLMNVMNRVSDTSFSYLFMDATGAIRYISRQAPLTGMPIVTFSDVLDSNYNIINIPYTAVQTMLDDLYVQNHIVLTRHGGGTVNAIDTTSVNKYGDRQLTNTVYDSVDSVLQDEANWVLAHNANPQLRIPYVDIILENSPALMGVILMRELIDMVKILRTSPGVATVTYQPLIHGIEHTITPANWQIKWYLDLVDSPATLPFFILDDAVRGRLDLSRLGY